MHVGFTPLHETHSRIFYALQQLGLLGVEINAELQRGRQIQAGDPDAGEPILPPRA